MEGEAPAHLRVKSLADLNEKKHRVFVELTFRGGSHESLADKHGKLRVASVYQEGIRFFLINGARVPKHRCVPSAWSVAPTDPVRLRAA